MFLLFWQFVMEELPYYLTMTFKTRKNVDSIKGRITASAVASNRAQACRAETTGCRDGRGAGVDCRAATETDFDFNLSTAYD